MPTNPDKNNKPSSSKKIEYVWKWLELQINKFTPKSILNIFPEKDRIYFIIITLIGFIFFKAYDFITNNKPLFYLIIGVLLLIIVVIFIDRYQENKNKPKNKLKKERSD